MQHGSVPLGIAAHEGHTQTVQRLLEAKASVNHQNKVVYVHVLHRMTHCYSQSTWASLVSISTHVCMITVVQSPSQYVNKYFIPRNSAYLFI